VSTRHTLIAAALAAVLGALMVPALAEAPGESQTMPGHAMGMGRMENGMMSGGMMSGDHMGGCMSMMQSMNNGDGLPNRQWQMHRPAEGSAEN
jgi:hypothetical protein